jgi:hypothetical protein
LALVAVAAWAAAVGCDLPPNPSRPRLYSMAALQALADHASTQPVFAEDAGVPGGLRINDYVVRKDDGSYAMALRTTWTEQYRSAYVTGEIWTGFEEVWQQPVYVPITGLAADGTPKLLPHGASDWTPIFSVGPDSAFYSPFWQTYYFQVDPATEANAFKSARDVLDSGRTLTPGPSRTMSLVPDTTLHPPDEMPADMPPLVVGGPRATESGFLDGNPISFLDLGKDNFTWDYELVVEATPLFMLVYRDKAGQLQPMNVPTVAGTGPLYANRNVNVTSDFVPHYGAFWRLHTVEVPSQARIFAPPKVAGDLSADYPPDLVGQTYDSAIADGTPRDLSQFVGRVALNPTECFSLYDNLATFENPKATCQWLDSQTAIEAAVPPSAITETDVHVTCPFVSYHDRPVPVVLP